MRFLRMLTNSVAGGALAAAYITLLILQLNPAVPMRPGAVVPLYATVLLFYGSNLAATFYVLIVLRQLVATEIFLPGWLSVRLLGWLSTLAASMAVVLMSWNLRGFETVLDAETARRMASTTIVSGLSAAAFLIIAVMQSSLGHRGNRLSGFVLAITVAVSLAVPAVIRGSGVEAPRRARYLDGGVAATTSTGPRVIMLIVDGGSLDYISPAVAEGRLPNLGKVLDAGAAMRLATLRPTQPAPVWTAVATGKYPSKNGVRSAGTYHVRNATGVIELLPDHCFSHALVHFGFLTEVPHDAGALQARPLWDVLSSSGISVGVVGWPLTDPVQPVRGYLVSDRFYAGADAFVVGKKSPGTFPPDASALANSAAEQADAEVPIFMAGGVADGPDIDGPAGGAVGRDRLYARVASELQQRFHPEFTAIRYQRLDSVGHTFLRYAMPRYFGDVSADERRRYGDVLGRAYMFVDDAVGSAMASLGDDDLLLVVSGFGMEPVSLGKRLLARAVGDPDLSGTHERAPDGFLLAYGAPVAPGKLPLGSVVDVTPTVLYFLGLPVAHDMDGYARADLFTRAFTAERPITFIPTYE